MRVFPLCNRRMFRFPDVLAFPFGFGCAPFLGVLFYAYICRVFVVILIPVWVLSPHSNGLAVSPLPCSGDLPESKAPSRSCDPQEFEG